MSNEGISKIQKKLETLFESINQITPMNDFLPYCVDGNNPYIEDLIIVLDALINKANIQKDNIVKDIERLNADINLFSRQLDLEVEDFPAFENFYLQKEYLENELNKINNKRSQVESEIKIQEKAIIKLSRDLNESCCIEEGYENNRIVSMETLKAVKDHKETLLIKITKLENERQSFYDTIVDLSKKLCKDTKLTYKENICQLKKQKDMLQQIYEERKNFFENISKEIDKREDLLNCKKRLFDYSLDENNIEKLKEYNSYLIDEQKRLFNDIFNRTVEELNEINNFIGKENIVYERTEDSLVEMRSLLYKYNNIKEKHNEISEYLIKRKDLLKKMTEFEVLASDPKRLFKSSFQLNTEEKFRNSAYPSLLRIEDLIINKINSFEETYGEFVFERKKYKNLLEKEIENRIINRTVFISRCDSPYRKKR